MRRIVPFAFAMSLSALAGAALAQSNAERAARLFDEAQQRTSAGDFAGACDLLAESQRLDPQLGTLLHRGHCLEKQGRIASAWLAFRAASGLAAQKNARGENEPREAVARRRAAQLEPFVSTLEIEVADEASGLMLARNGEVIAREMWSKRVPVDPGVHVITAEAPGRVPHNQTIEVGRHRRPIRVRIPVLDRVAETRAPIANAPPIAVQRPSDASDVRDASDASETPYRIVSYAIAGTGVAALAVGVVFGLKADRTLSDRDELCPDGKCRLVQSRADRVFELTRRADRQATVANVSFIAGGALVAAGAILFFLAPEDNSQPTLSLHGAPGLSVRLRL